ncbi:MAG: hypothetical protein PHW04_01415 [Candidatus Wallbacteria bacterium]|nr:hypothetical protein [Candidatus Wallbacteria bacterium]
MKYLSIIFLLAAIFAALTEPVGTVDLNLAFYYHPQVLLYYYPEFHTFMRPIEGRLTDSVIADTLKNRKLEQERIRAKNKSKQEEIKKKLNALDEEKNRLSIRILGEQSSIWEQQQKAASSNPSELTNTLKQHEEMERALSPYQKKLDSIEIQSDELKSEQEKLINSEFLVEFYSPAETSREIDQIMAEIKDTLKKVAGKSGIQLILNSSFYDNEFSSEKTTSPGNAGGDYDRMNMVVSGEPKTHKDDKAGPDEGAKIFIKSFISGFSEKRLPFKREDLNEFILGESHDLTVDVVSALLDNSEISPKFKAAVIQYLKDSLKAK